MEELFSIAESLSPKEAWLRKHHIHVSHYPQFNGQEEDEFGNTLYTWQAWVGDENTTALGGYDDVGVGMDELSALVDLATKQNWKMWNQ